MTNTKPPAFAEIAEADATGRTREIYDDFKASIGLPMVNLVYRHMATTPGCLEWAWALLKPLFVGGLIARDADVLIADLGLDKPPSLSQDDIRSAGVDAQAESVIIQTLDAYNRANPMNLIALGVLRRELEDPTPDNADAAPELNITPSRDVGALPPMAKVGSLPMEIQAVLGVLAAQAGVGGAAVIPTLYRHLTAWPGYLDLAAATAAPLIEDGSIGREVSALQIATRQVADDMPRYAISLPAPSAHQQDNLLGLIDMFPTLIARMIVIGVHLRRSMPD